MHRITLTIESDLESKLRAESKRDDRSMSNVARIALARHFGLSISKPAKPARKQKGGAK